MQASDSVPRGEVAAMVQDVLARREFGQGESMIEELVAWVLARIEPGGAVEAGRFLFALVVSVLAGVLLYLLARFVAAGRLRRARAGAEDGPDGAGGPTIAQRVRELRRQARAARERGERRVALQKLLFALVLGLGERGDLQYRDAWTNRELLRRGRPAPEVERFLAPLVVELEAKEFGREAATEADLDRLESICDRALGAAEGAAA